jgi:hypothetical protein
MHNKPVMSRGTLRRVGRRVHGRRRHWEVHTGLMAGPPWMKQYAITRAKTEVHEHRAGSMDSGFRGCEEIGAAGGADRRASRTMMPREPGRPLRRTGL